MRTLHALAGVAGGRVAMNNAVEVMYRWESGPRAATLALAELMRARDRTPGV